MKKTLLFLLCSFFSLSGYSQAPTNGLVAYWPFDGNLNDSGSNGINGTNFNATFSSNVFAESNKAVDFSNTNPSITTVNQYGSHPANANLNFGLADDFSIDFNAYIKTPYIHAGGFYDYGTNSYATGVWYWNQNGFLQLQFNFGNGSVGSTNGGLLYDTWQHITAVKTGTLIKIYINGILNASANAGVTTPNYSSVTGRFGAMYFSSFSPPQYNGANAKMDELRIYNRALTDEEITTLYQLNLLENPDFELPSAELIFYPNPTKDIIRFNKTIKNIEVYDVTGKYIKVQLQNNVVDLSGLNKGMYLLKTVDSNDKTAISKLIKE
jgi:hypothetical protein